MCCGEDRGAETTQSLADIKRQVRLLRGAPCGLQSRDQWCRASLVKACSVASVRPTVQPHPRRQ
eukprot:2202746-Pleurochrysis_carterae.AAC.1